jgi:hypothetical protein
MNKKDKKLKRDQLFLQGLKFCMKCSNTKSITKFFNHNSINDLKLHIEKQFESWMTWENHGVLNKNWKDNDSTTWTRQIDHIIPQSTFHYTSMDCQEFRNCWSLNNLRPLSALQNIKDGDRGHRKEKKKDYGKI